MNAPAGPEGSATGRVVAGTAVVGAFVSWGLFPIFFKAMEHVPSTEIVAHRFVWTALVLAAALTFLGRWAKVLRVLGDRRLALALLASSFALSVNWVVFIWAVGDGRVVDTSLGYFGSPLASVVLGVVLLKERLNPWQWLAVGLAGAAVVNMIVGAGTLPWVSLTLAIVWSFYGFLRKLTPVDAIDGLFVETLVLTPPAIAYLLWLAAVGAGNFGHGDGATDLLIVSSGIVTAIPLCCYAFAARRLRLVTLGIFQYITPTLTFLLGVFLYNEPFDGTKQITFALIWLALIVYTADAIRVGRRKSA